MTTKPTTTHRRGEHLQHVRTALESWSFKTKRARYTPSSLTAPSLLPDTALTTLAWALHICTIGDIEDAVNWVYARQHGAEILAVLGAVDQHEGNRKEEVQKALKRRSATEARQRERKRAQEVEQEEQRKAKLTTEASNGKPPRKRRAPMQRSSVMSFQSPKTPISATPRVALTPVQVVSSFVKSVWIRTSSTLALSVILSM